MSKKLSRYLCFSILSLFIACAPKPMMAPPAIYEEKELTLKEVLAKAGKDIELLKAITDITVEMNNEPHSFINASVLIKKPDWLHMRIYQLGMLVRDFVIRDNELYVLSGKNDSNLKNLGNELHNAIFWWEDYGSGAMRREGDIYIIKAPGKEINVNSSTLLPVSQEITTHNKKISISYESPTNDEGLWYPELLTIHMDNFTFIVKIKKLIKNPLPGEFDFQLPAEG